MKNRLFRIVSVGCLAVLTVLCACVFAACEKPTRYDFVETKVDDNTSQDEDDPFGGILDMDGMFAGMSAMYKDSYLEITDKKIKWVLSSDKSTDGTMTYTKDGDKYLLAGDYIQSLKSSMESMYDGIGGGYINVTDMKIDYYGKETESGFEIVLEESFDIAVVGSTAQHVSMTFRYIFKKA